MAQLSPWVNKRFTWNKMFKHSSDSFMMNCFLFEGLLIPLLFFAIFLHWQNLTFTQRLMIATAYHVLRIGPYMQSFAYFYTLAHKEAHTAAGFCADPFNNFLSRNCFNWYVSLFYGVMPGTFSFGHSLNHHAHDNDEKDVVTTADKPRDSVVNFICYLPRWTLYALNLSSIVQFASEGNVKVAMKLIAGTIYWVAWLSMWFRLNKTFAFLFVLYPVAENIILLACSKFDCSFFPQQPVSFFVCCFLSSSSHALFTCFFLLASFIFSSIIYHLPSYFIICSSLFSLPPYHHVKSIGLGMHSMTITTVSMFRV